jgi:hypothetical protein
MDPRSSRSDALVLAVDETTLDIGAALCRRRSTEWPLLVVSHPGEALRDIHRRRPNVLFVCVAPARIDSTAALLEELSRRLSRGNPALVAVAATHDEAVERAVRVAGSSCYVALDSQADDDLLDELLRELGVASRASPASPASPAHSLRAPPPSQRGLPPPPPIGPPHPGRGRTRSRPSFRY